MVSKARGIGAGILKTLGFSIIIGGVALAVYSGVVMDDSNNGISALDRVAVALGLSVVLMLIGAGVASLSGMLLEDSEKEKEVQNQRS